MLCSSWWCSKIKKKEACGCVTTIAIGCIGPYWRSTCISTVCTELLLNSTNVLPVVTSLSVFDACFVGHLSLLHCFEVLTLRGRCRVHNAGVAETGEPFLHDGRDNFYHVQCLFTWNMSFFSHFFTRWKKISRYQINTVQCVIEVEIGTLLFCLWVWKWPLAFWAAFRSRFLCCYQSLYAWVVLKTGHLCGQAFSVAIWMKVCFYSYLYISRWAPNGKRRSSEKRN